jgi:hypothetical protein
MTDIQDPPSMLRTLTRACREHRRKLEHSQAAVAERANLSRQAIVEFEAARAWPRDPDRVVSGYGDDPTTTALLWQIAATRFARDAGASLGERGKAMAG